MADAPPAGAVPTPRPVRDYFASMGVRGAEAGLTVALLEPGESGMSAPPELVSAASSEAPSTEPSPLAALRDVSRDHARGDYPGGLTCRVAITRSPMPR